MQLHKLCHSPQGILVCKCGVHLLICYDCVAGLAAVRPWNTDKDKVCVDNDTDLVEPLIMDTLKSGQPPSVCPLPILSIHFYL